MSKPEIDNPQQALLPSASTEIVRFERNLLNVGLFGMQERASEPRYTRTVTIRNDNYEQESVEFRSASGLPTSSDRDKFMAFCRICAEQRSREGKLTNPIRFKAARLFKELGLTDGGTHYQEFYAWTQRMVDTTITSKNVIFFAAGKRYINSTEHIFESCKRVGSKIDKKTEDDYEVVLAPWLLANLNVNYVIAEDFATYKRLKKPSSKCLFGPLHLFFAKSQGMVYTRDYQDLCEFLGMQSYDYPSKIKSTLGKALDELKAVDYLSHWKLELMATKPGYKVLLWPGKAILENLRSHGALGAGEAHDGQSEAEIQERVNSVTYQWVRSGLTAFGVAEHMAEKLAKHHDHGRILDLIEWLSFEKSTDKEGKIRNPAGMLVHYIKNPKGVDPIPAGFVTSRRRRALEAARLEQSAQEQRKLTLELEYRMWKDERAKEELARLFPGTARAGELAKIVAERRSADKDFAKMHPEQRTFIAEQILLQRVRDEMEFMPLEQWAKKREQWAKQDSQRSLFAN